MEKRELQQGDLILVEVSKIPNGAKKIAFNGIVLQGEGANTHTIAVSDVDGVYEQDGIWYIEVNKKTDLIHQEHGRRTINPGIKKRLIEREFDYEEMEARKTRD